MCSQTISNRIDHAFWSPFPWVAHYADALRWGDAVVRGRLLETCCGIPILQVPEEDLLAVGNTNPRADVARMSNPEPTPDRLPKKGTGAPRAPVYGKIPTFDDPEETRLPAIDLLEGFHPGGPCLYRRVLTSALVHGSVLPA